MFGYHKFKRKVRNFLETWGIKEKTINFDFKKQNQELILLANGYTLDINIDLKIVKDKDVFVCNEFFRHSCFNDIVENNNVLFFALDSADSYQRVVPRRQGLSVREAYEKYLFPILNSKTNLVIPKSVIPFLLKEFPHSGLCSSEMFIYECRKLNKLSSHKIIEQGIGHTPQFMLLAGIILGYKKIHLHGLEHNYVKDILNKDPKCGTHFYGESYREVLELNDGKGLPREAYRVTLSKLFEGNAKTFKGYEQLADLAKELGVEVIDHSNGSLFMFQDYSLWDLVEPKNNN
jgi:hypothetical protein